MSKQRIQYTQIRVPQSHGIFRKVEQVPDQYVNEHPKVIRIKVFKC